MVSLILLAAAGPAKTGQDARPLLREVAGASQNLATFRAEGQISQDLDLPFVGGKRNLTFRVATRSPGQMRVELGGLPDYRDLMSGGRENLTAICDGPNGWYYSDKGEHYFKIAPGENTQVFCMAGTLTSFEHVANDVISATITGTGHAEFEGRGVSCAMVRARYRVIPDLTVPPYMVLKLGRVSRTMCIDQARKLILSDHLEADMDAGPLPYHIDETVTYDRIERNPDLPASLFEFHPANGMTLFVPPEPPRPPAAPPASPAPIRSPNVHTMPEPIFKVDPEYSQEAWDEGIQGEVIVLADIGPDGTMSNLRIQQPIGYGLDEKAVECVRQWRFRPAMEGDRPVNGVAGVYLNFSLPAERPAHPSPGPVPRPVPPLRLPVVELKPPTDLDDFFYLVAINLKAPALCAKIDPMADGGGAGMAQRGYQVQTMQSKCYFAVAEALHDPKLCDYVKPVKTSVLDGSNLDKAKCASLLPGSAIATPDVYRMEQFVSLMRKTGADDSQVAECRYRMEPYNNPAHVTYTKLLKQKVFLDRLRTAKSFAEVWSPARARPAFALEYLYQMVAIDANDADLCARISPNATFVEVKMPTRLLRSQCYLAIADNRRDAALCDQLPRSGTSPYVISKFDSQESCRSDIEIYSRPDFNSKLTYGPAFMPQAADFTTALEQIGYPRSEAASLVPKPSPDDYWTCFPVLDRATFLQRVMRLK